jgi:hypothetical protein
METRRKISLWVSRLFGLLAVVDFAFTLFQSYLGYGVQEFVSNPLIQILVYGVFAITLVWRNLELENEISYIKNTRPNIVAEHVELEKPFPIKINGIPTNQIVERYYLIFRNEKTKQIYRLVDTEKVHAIVDFYDKKYCQHLPQYSHEDGFWLGSKPSYERSADKPQGYPIIIEASGRPQGLHLVIRLQGSNDLYVFSEKSYDLSKKSFEPFQEVLKLIDSKYFVRIQIRTGNFDMEPVWFLLSNHGAEKAPEFERLNKPPREFSASKTTTQHHL